MYNIRLLLHCLFQGSVSMDVFCLPRKKISQYKMLDDVLGGKMSTFDFIIVFIIGPVFQGCSAYFAATVTPSLYCWQRCMDMKHTQALVIHMSLEEAGKCGVRACMSVR